MANDSTFFQDLLPQLTLEEKVKLLSGHGDFKSAGGAERLGIPPITTCDAINGIRGADSGDIAGDSTTASFPSTTCIASTWNDELLYRFGERLAHEAKLQIAQVILGPTVNMHRDPRGGRNFEAFSEDPLLTGRLAAAIVNGIQKHGVGACPKHLVCNDGETFRKLYNVDEKVNSRTVRELYLASFQHLLRESDPVGLMTAYNKLEGTYCCDHNVLLDDIVRKEWGFGGLIMSDWHGTTSTVAATLAGLDLEMPLNTHRGQKLVDAVRAGEVSEEVINIRAKHLLRLRDRLRDSYSDAAPRSVVSDETNTIARQIAQEGIVLLKNKGNVLPLDLKETSKVAVIGEGAWEPVVCGGGSAYVKPQYKHSFYDILQKTHPGPHQISLSKGVRTRVVIPIATKEKLNAQDARHGVDVAYYNNDSPDPIFTEFLEKPNVSMRGKYKPGLDIFKSRLEMSTKLVPDTTGKHTVAVRCSGPFSLEVDGKEVLAGPGPEFTTEQWLFNPTLFESRVDVPMTAGQPHAIRLIMRSPKPLVGQLTPYSAMLCFEEFVNEELAIADAVAKAKEADTAVIFAGRTDQHESESFDLADMHMPANQTALIRAVAAAARRTVLVLHCGTPIDVSPFVDDVDVVVNSHFAGQEGAQAIVDIVTGKINPSGKLATTWFKTLDDAPSNQHFPSKKLEDGSVSIQYKEGLEMGYRVSNYERRLRWPFGFGLSYTTFGYTDLKVTVDESAEKPVLKTSVSVTNQGKVAGKEIVQLYITPSQSNSVWRPEKELKAFKKVALQPGEQVTVDLEVELKIAASYWDETAVKWRLDEGTYGAKIGDLVQSFDITNAATWNGL